MKFSIREDNIFIPLGALIYAFVFCYVCITYITPIYSYVNFSFVYSAQGFSNFILLSLAMSLLICIQKGYVRRFFIALLYIMSIVPFMCLYFCGVNYQGYNNFFSNGMAAYIVIAIVTAIPWKYRLSRHRREVCNLGITIDMVICILTIFTIFTLARYILLNGLGIFNLNLLNVYKTRFLLRETMDGTFAYVDSWTMKIFNPLCIILSVHLKRYKRAACFTVLQVVLFGFSSHKSVLITAFILLVFYFCADRFLLRTRSLFYCAVLGSWAIPFSNLAILLSLWRRALLVPAQLNYYYFDYFSRHEFDWFAKSFLRHFVVSHYDMVLPRVIGQEFFNNAATNANTGFLGAGYAQGGMIVVIIYAIIIGTAIRMVDLYSEAISPRIAVSITLLPMVGTFISSDLPTNFLTGGFLVAFLLLSILSRCKDREKLKERLWKYDNL